MTETDPSADGALERLFEEARRVVERQIRVGEGLDSKAAQILRFDALLLGVLLTGASVAGRTGLVDDIPWWIAALLVLGFLLLVASTLFAVRSYRFREVYVRVHADDLVRARVEEAGEEAVLDASVRGYAEGIRRNGASLDGAARRLDTSIQTLWLGLAVLSMATGILMLVEAAS